jgi:hypothetical protein
MRATYKSVVHGDDDVPLDKLKYNVTPRLVTLLTFAHRSAGAASALRFSYYGKKRLQTEADRLRIANLVAGSGQRVKLDEVAHVLAGDILPPRRHITQEYIRRAAILLAAIEQYGSRRDGGTPETFTAYLDLVRRGSETGSTSWAKFAGQRRDKLLELHRDSVKVAAPVKQLYEWVSEDELLAAEPLLRTAVLYWGLTRHHAATVDRMAISAVMAHELRAGGLDPHGLFVLDESEHGREAQELWKGVLPPARPARLQGDLTPVLEHFAHHVALALSELWQRLERHQDQEDRLPWLMQRPPDEVDRLIFEAVEKRGSATSTVILGDLPAPRPPLRTLQRRLKRLVHEGLLAKLGNRKDAFYRVSERL